jgi:hypothetical protein
MEGGMSWFTNIFKTNVGDSVAKVSDSVFGGIDKLFTSDAERLEWAVKKQELINKIEEFVQTQVSSRHAADMQSDSWLSKNIRPLALIHFLVAMDIVIGLSLFGHPVSAAVVGFIELGLQLGLSFYYGGRTVEKIIKMIATKNKGE